MSIRVPFSVPGHLTLDDQNPPPIPATPNPFDSTAQFPWDPSWVVQSQSPFGRIFPVLNNTPPSLNGSLGPDAYGDNQLRPPSQQPALPVGWLRPQSMAQHETGIPWRCPCK